MHVLTEKDVRASFVNASLRERNAIPLPDRFPDVGWGAIDFLGWRDPKLPLMGYIIVPVDEKPVGILLRETESRTRARPQCSWCADVTLPNDVAFFIAKRAGASGRNGNTIGTLACARFECNGNVRKPPLVAYLGFDVEAARQRRIEALRTSVTGFARDVRDGA
ncbi:MAG: FBP domain-containing protein [Microbacterium sp.]|uniref:FBP domain-containing protein n=1 Tax=Microbacterium sp. TaxID=51671 RepID=UPI00092957CD|nr:FBP domain-containing protein [Microbacterium sp.]MBN9173426.1 FBP domain-containing protein [Microbacterium sp.]MBN9191218.1 FBP domain-containing protein [Microbacterium sp.]OJU70868.1 MAG: translation elongation factor [Microbacterium sp. 70-38]